MVGQMCVDYKDLNKACPKDNFPLPHIDVLVDSAAASLCDVLIYGWVFWVQSDLYGHYG